MKHISFISSRTSFFCCCLALISNVGNHFYLNNIYFCTILYIYFITFYFVLFIVNSENKNLSFFCFNVSFYVSMYRHLCIPRAEWRQFGRVRFYFKYLNLALLLNVKSLTQVRQVGGKHALARTACAPNGRHCLTLTRRISLRINNILLHRICRILRAEELYVEIRILS